MKKELELYIHIPFCVKKCDYCDFLSFPASEATQEEYTNALLQEIRYYGTQMTDYEVVTIYFGGGTPSWLATEWMLEILDVIGDCFAIRRDAEVTMECNPGTVTYDKLKEYYRNGINRLSIGLQSTENSELELLGRIHTYEQFLKTYEMARNAGFANINIDLMSGIPHQNLELFAKSLLRVIRLQPEHISVYSLIIEEGTPFYSRYKFDVVMQQAGLKTEHLPSEDEVFRIMKATQQLLEKHGYKRYEISNYAKTGYESRHNIGYWERAEYLGMGLGAASLVDETRFTNTKDIHTYMKNAAEIKEQMFINEEDRSRSVFGCNLHMEANKLTRHEAMEEYMFLGLRKIDGISREEFQRQFGTPIDGVYGQVIHKLRQEGLLEQRGGRVYLTDRGLDVSNYAMAQFLQ